MKGRGGMFRHGEANLPRGVNPKIKSQSSWKGVVVWVKTYTIKTYCYETRK
jgi:hypothetical protein